MGQAVPLDQFKEMVGQEIGLSEWLAIDQARINAFAACTEDRQWIHVDPEKAKAGPYGKTIAHGYMALSLLSFFNYQNRFFPSGIKMSLNYGLNKVRFISPVPVGSRLRNRAVLKEVVEKGEGRILMAIENTIEIEGQDKPAVVAETLSMLIV
jgi:acyl dehydratase